VITSCHVSEKCKTGLTRALPTRTDPAPANAHFKPNQPEADAANRQNQSCVALTCTSIGGSYAKAVTADKRLAQDAIAALASEAPER
jgi:hypothetical protein